jgi:hypothetical protein
MRWDGMHNLVSSMAGCETVLTDGRKLPSQATPVLPAWYCLVGVWDAGSRTAWLAFRSACVTGCLKPTVVCWCCTAAAGGGDILFVPAAAGGTLVSNSSDATCTVVCP